MGISRELLRTVCEPFFEQMLTALQQALQETSKKEGSDVTHTVATMTHMTKTASFQSVFHPPSHLQSQLATMLDEESTEADELGAFASLLSSPSSGEESIDNVEAKSPVTESLGSETPSQASLEELEQVGDPEK